MTGPGNGTKGWSWWKAGQLASFLVSLASAALGQTVTGTLTDETGGILANASVMAVNRNTGVSYATRSTGAGVYRITVLPVGTYVIKAEVQGFKSITTNPITLDSGQTARVNLKFELGAMREEVPVAGVNPNLQTENAVVGAVVSGSTVVSLPLNGRNFVQLTLLLPGVQTHAPDTFNGTKQSTDSGRPYVNGQREQSNNFMLDGIDMNETVDDVVAYYPSPDAIAEIRVETNNYSAEFGNVAGGLVTVVTKSGTSEFRGSAFEFARNDALDAISWKNNRSGARKAGLSQHIFGATFGGPLVKKKAFFFADYQGQRTDNPGEAVATVAPLAWRKGDFSSLLARGLVITDPLTGLPFPDNHVPASRFSPAARALLGDTASYPEPNRPGLTGNYVHRANTTTRNHQGDLRIDANVGQNDNVLVRGSVGKYATGTAQPVFPLALGNAFLSDTQNVAANWTHTFSPSLASELRAGFSHVTINRTPTDPAGVGNYNQKLGIPGGQPLPGSSLLNFNDGLDAVGNPGFREDSNSKSLQVSGKVSLSRGRHFVSLGGQLLHYQMDVVFSSFSGLMGSFDFGGPGNFTGSGFANFLLDQVVGKRVLLNRAGTPAARWTQVQNRIGVFFQDDFKIRPSLTLNLGLRWEYTSPLVEKNNRQLNWDVNTGQEIIPGNGGVSDATTTAYYGGFGPRFGFAWTADERTVLRGGYGIVRYMEGTGLNNRLPINPPYYHEVARTYAITAGSLARGFQDLASTDASLSDVQLRAWQTSIQPQLTRQLNLFFEHRVTDTTSLDVGYVGSRSTHVISFRDINQALPGTGDPATWAPITARRRLPQYGIIRYTSDDSKAAYDGLQVMLRRRMNNGLEFLASYTFSKALGDNPGFYGPGWGGRGASFETAGVGGDGNYDSYNPMRDYGPLWFSAKHTGALSGTYEFPVGKGRKIGSDWKGVTQALLGGWNVSSILTVRSGLPITVVSGWAPGRSLQTSGFIRERPDKVGNPNVSNPDWNRWLDINAFAPQPLGTFGNSGVGIARGPSYYNVDVRLDKDLDFGASRFLTLRVEAFNVLNHPNKGLPIRDTSDPNFGKVLETANSQRILELAARFRF